MRCAAFLCVIACSSVAPVSAADAPPPMFIGSLTYEVTIAGTGAPADLARKAIESRATIDIGGEDGRLVRIERPDGLMKGTVVIDRTTRAWGFRRPDGTGRDFTPKEFQTMDEMGAELPSLVERHPLLFRTDLEPLESTTPIAGRACREHRVTGSKFVRDGAKARLWIAEDLRLPPLRYDFADPDGAFRVQAPLPLQFPLPAGTVLKSESEELGTTVTYTATSLTAGEPDASRFTLPAPVAEAD